ncbi:MAG TPA: histidine phosphatase family protein [Nocardioides sp.]
MRLLLIRHGQTPNNVLGALDTGFPGAGLTALGQAQARAVPNALDGEEIAGVYASRLVRTQLTGTPLAQSRGLEVVVQPGLEEISAGHVEMRSDRDAVRTYVKCISNWLVGDLDLRMPGGTSGHEFFAGYDTAVRSIIQAHGPNDTVALFSHGAAIRAFAALASELDPAQAKDLHIMNTGMAVLEGDPSDGWELTTWHHEPLGGHDLDDESAHDVTGETADEAIAEA